MGWFGNLLKGVGVDLVGGLLGGGGSNIFSGSTPLSSVGPNVVPTSALQTPFDFSGLINTPSYLNSVGDVLGGGGGGVLPSLSDFLMNSGGDLMSGSTPLNAVSPVGMNPGEQPVSTALPGDLMAGSTPLSAQSPLGMNPGEQLLAPQGGATAGQQPGIAQTPAALPPANTLTPPAAASGGLDIKGLTELLGTLGLGVGALGGNGGLGPDADALRAQAGQYHDLVNNQLLPTALANQQGMINGQALNALERRLNQKEASIRKSYADMGMSGSTMEAQDLNSARDATQQEVFTTGLDMATSGLATAANYAGLESNIYSQLMQAQIAKDKELQDAIAAFAGAAAK